MTDETPQPSPDETVRVRLTRRMLQTVLDGLDYATELAERTEDPAWSDADYAAVRDAAQAMRASAVPDTGTVWVVLTHAQAGDLDHDLGTITDLEVLDVPPAWDLVHPSDNGPGGQTCRVANVNGGDSVPWQPEPAELQIPELVREALEDFYPGEDTASMTDLYILEGALDTLELDQHDGGDHADRIREISAAVEILRAQHAGHISCTPEGCVIR